MGTGPAREGDEVREGRDRRGAEEEVEDAVRRGCRGRARERLQAREPAGREVPEQRAERHGVVVFVRGKGFGVGFLSVTAPSSQLLALGDDDLTDWKTHTGRVRHQHFAPETGSMAETYDHNVIAF